MAGMRVVRKEPSGVGWCVAESEAGSSSHTAQTKALAVEQARADLRGMAGGGRLRVYLVSGALEYERFVEGPRPDEPVAAPPVEQPPTVGQVRQQIKREGVEVDKGLDALGTGLSLLGVLGVSVTNATISPEVQDALDGGWFAVFLATLTWSLGCAGAMVVVLRSGLVGNSLAIPVTLCFLVALGIASAVGQGILDLDLATSHGPGPWNVVGTFVSAALVTYGWLGAFVGAGVGAWLGYRAAPLVDKDFLR